MALEACFQLTTNAPTPTPTITRACALHAQKEKKLNLLPNREPRRALSSSFSSSSSPSSIQFPPASRTSRGTYLICQAKNAVEEVLEVTDQSWDKLVIESKIPVVVEFWAPWCGPCKMVEPVMDELAKEYAGKIACYKINTDDSLKMASQYGIRSIPTVLLFKNGEKKESVTGAVRKSSLSATIEKHLEV